MQLSLNDHPMTLIDFFFFCGRSTINDLGQEQGLPNMWPKHKSALLAPLYQPV